MTKSQKVIGILLVIGAIASVFLLLPKTSGDQSLGDSGYPLYLKSMVSTAVTVTSTSATLLSPSSGRVYAIFGNTGSSTVFLSLNGGAATSSSGIILREGISYTIDSTNQYIGAVTAITGSGTSTVAVTYSQ